MIEMRTVRVRMWIWGPGGRGVRVLTDAVRTWVRRPVGGAR